MSKNIYKINKKQGYLKHWIVKFVFINCDISESDYKNTEQ